MLYVGFYNVNENINHLDDDNIHIIQYKVWAGAVYAIFYIFCVHGSEC